MLAIGTFLEPQALVEMGDGKDNKPLARVLAISCGDKFSCISPEVLCWRRN